MQLKEINNTRYRKHLKVVFASTAILLIFLSLSLSTFFIVAFSTPDVNHFYHNLAGMLAAVAVVVFILNKIRHHPYLLEVVYVWDLKQQLNKIYRKQRNIKAAVEKNDINAMVIMLFFYRGSKQLYELDENIITLDSVIFELRAIEKTMQDANISLDDNSYNQSMLDQF